MRKKNSKMKSIVKCFLSVCILLTGNVLNPIDVDAQDISSYASTKTLIISSLYQNDYSDTLNGCNATIASSGCALTSATMVVNYLTSSSLIPPQVNKDLGTSACPIVWTKVASVYGITFERMITTGLTESFITSELVTRLNNGLPTIVGMSYNNTTHFVVVKGYTYSNTTYTFKINDPNKNSGKTTLANYINAGANIISLVEYAK